MLVLLSFCCCSLTKLCLTLCDPMECSMPGHPVHHQLLEFAQTHVQSVMPSNHLILCHSLFFLPSVFPGIRIFSKESGSLHELAKVLEFQLQHQSFQWLFRRDFLQDGLVRSPSWPRDSQESSPTPQFKIINSLAVCFLYSPTLTSIHDYWKNSFD